jgi:endonuclease/exonuclease/phosphatase family metal-dependent hydrolase
VGKGVEVSVLIYNIEGLQWPARTGRAKYLRQIGDNLRRLRESGTAPDVILFQEAFSSAAIQAVNLTGYPVIVRGPPRAAPSNFSADGKLPGRPSRTKGELGIRLVSSGLIIASRFPVTQTAYDAYSKASCAGFDCLSNKGVMLARITVPGVPEPVDIANTHMNARGAAKVSPERTLASHRAQAEELAMFLRHRHAPGRAMILAGDFNMANSAERFAFFRRVLPMNMVHEYCLQRPTCEVRMSWDGDAPWMDTEDLQFFSSGNRVAIAPVRVRAMFDGSPGSPRLSDHDGLEVTYRLTMAP